MIGLMLASCQSDSYQVHGFAHQLLEGDTILMAHGVEPESPFAMTTVSGGKFWLEGSVVIPGFLPSFPA